MPKKVVLAIGLPGSGKSTYFKQRRVIPLSSDLLRLLLADDPTDQRYQDFVFRCLRYLLRLRLEMERPITYIDATNLSRGERASYIRIAQEHGAEVEAIFFDVPLGVCQQRNRSRGRQVPDDAMLRLAERLTAPALEEGLSSITTIHTDGSATVEPKP